MPSIFPPAESIEPIAPVPNLADISDLAEAPVPDRNLVSSWSAASMDGYMTAMNRCKARAAAERAGRHQAAGASHYDVLSALASAELAAPEDEKPWHAARLDAYAAAYGLRGWYRLTDFRGKPAIQINFIRTYLDGDRGRYFVHSADAWMHGPTNHWVVDRDTGRTVYRAIASKIAHQWIAEHEGTAA